MYSINNKFEIIEDKLKKLGIDFNVSKLCNPEYSYMMITFNIERLSKELLRFLNEFDYLEYNISIQNSTTTNENDEVVTKYLFNVSIVVY